MKYQPIQKVHRGEPLYTYLIRDYIKMQNLIPNIGASISLILGLLAIIWPSKIKDFVSIKSIGKEGVSEVRATYGALFAGIFLYALFTQTPEAFIALGVGWLSATIIRWLLYYSAL